MNKSVVIENINIDIPVKKIFMRLGYRQKTKITEDQNNKIINTIEESFNYCEIKGVYLRADIVKNSDDEVELNKSIILKGRSISDFLSKSIEVFLIGVTSGKDILEYRENKMNNGDTFTSVIADAVGSETAEAAADWLNDFLNKLVRKEGVSLTKRRFSPGYGDLELSTQKQIYDMLEMSKIGVKLSDNFILKPEKSITAIIGIEGS